MTKFIDPKARKAKDDADTRKRFETPKPRPNVARREFARKAKDS